MLTVAELRNLLNIIPVGYKSPESIRFVPANKTYIPEYKRLGVITIADEYQVGAVATSATNFFCNIPGCQNIFEDAAAYQTHFNNIHRYLCSVCRRSLPTAHLLDLHISERHDSYFATCVERGEPMYACLLEECKEKMLTQAQRKDHCISIHKFPANFRFEKLCGNVSKRTQENKKANASDKATEPMETSDINLVVNEIKAISFGQPRERTFQNKNTSKTKDAFKDLTKLKNALEKI